MRKTLSLILGIFLLLSLSSIFLHPSLLYIANWFGPLLGSSIYTFMSLIFILFGDPLRYYDILLIWGLVALITGLIIRRRVGALFTVFFIWFFLVPCLVISGYGIADNLMSIPFEEYEAIMVIPPPPSGGYITQFLDAPIFGEFIEFFIEMMTTLEDSTPSIGMLMSFTYPFIGYYVMKLVIMVIVSLIGVEVGVFLEKQSAPHLSKLRGFLQTKLDEFGGFRFSPAIIFFLIFSSLFVYPVNAQDFEDGVYSENVVCLCDNSGRTLFSSIFVDSEMDLSSDMNGGASEGLVMACIVAFDYELDGLSEIHSIISYDLLPFLNLAPRTVLVTAYIDTSVEDAVERADVIASGFEYMYGIGLERIVGVEQEVNNELFTRNLNLTVVSYYSLDSYEEVISVGLSPFSGHFGLYSMVNGAIENGRLVPGIVEESCDASVTAFGFFRLNELYSYLPADMMIPEMEGIIEPYLDKMISFTVLSSYWGEWLGNQHSSTFYVKDVLDTTTAATYSMESDLSLIGLAALNDTLPDAPEAIMKISTSLPFDSLILQFAHTFLSDWGDLDIFTGSPGVNSYQFSLPYLNLPEDVDIRKNVDGKVKPGKEVVVDITVTNNGIRRLTNVKINDTMAYIGHPYSPEITSGGATATWSSINPGESNTLTYSVKFHESGIYNLPPALIQYEKDDKIYVDASNRREVTLTRPGSIKLASSLWYNLSSLLDLVIPNMGYIVLLSVSLLVLLFILYSFYKGIIGWLREDYTLPPVDTI